MWCIHPLGTLVFADLASGGKLDLSGDPQAASEVIRQARLDVAFSRGSLGSFSSNTVQVSIRVNQRAFEEISAANSIIRDTDFAAETSELTRSQILVQAGNSVLAIANAQSQNVLTLLGG